MSITVNTFLSLALKEIRSARAGDVVNPDDMDDALAIFNELLDALNADERALYTSAFPSFTLTPNLQPHTIGLAANAPTFSVAIGRPARVIGANIILANNIRATLTIRDSEWWRSLHAPAVTSSVPGDLFYSPDWPNGSIWLYPVPLTAYGLELETQTQLAQVTLNDTLDLPPGYQQALRLTTAELLAPAFGQTVSASTAQKARSARALVWADNDEIPTLSTRDAGMPGSAYGRSGWDYRTGQIR